MTCFFVNNQHAQRGSTLLEVLVSVFVLGFGLLALVTLQLRTVMTARESENQTIIAQATDSLIEGMTMNPNLTLNQLADNVEVNTRSFDSYQANFNAIRTAGAACNNDAVLQGADAANLAVGLSKQALADAQVCTFVKRANQVPGLNNLTMRICPNETVQNSTSRPALNAAGNNIACGGGGNVTVVKVVWTQAVDDSNVVNSAAGNGLTMFGNEIVYGYQSVLGQ